MTILSHKKKIPKHERRSILIKKQSNCIVFAAVIVAQHLRNYNKIKIVCFKADLGGGGGVGVGFDPVSYLFLSEIFISLFDFAKIRKIK